MSVVGDLLFLFFACNVSSELTMCIEFCLNSTALKRAVSWDRGQNMSGLITVVGIHCTIVR